jgi:VanZ family protein
MSGSDDFRWMMLFITFLIVAESIILVYFSLLPSGSVPTFRTGFLRPGDIEHFTSFFIYGALWIVFLKTTGMKKKNIIIVLIIGSLFGLSNEIIQGFVPTRMFDLVDWFVDTLGTGGGGGVVAKIIQNRG